MTVAGQTDGLTALERLRLHVHDHATFAFSPEDAEEILEEYEVALTELQHRRDVRKKIHRLHAEYAEHRDALPIDSLDRRFAQICVELTSEILRMFPEAGAPNSALGEHP